ncbi:MAG: LPS-assembly protein LptD, partial [Muribaculaceae bacterium]|nr:LPS-assembly protein LptD [Muribaculaceae bacterium]
MTCLLGFASEPVDSISVAPQQADSVPAGPKKRIIRDKVDLDNTVNFTSSDSMIVIGRNHSYMYGNRKVPYGDLQLTAENIDLDLKTSNVNASGVTDSLGVRKGTPNFSQGGESYDSESMSYNFKTERGYITNVITQQGEGYLTGGQAKRIENGEFYIKDGRYTTCDDHEHPHFHLQITKGKVKPGSNIVTGPAYMVLAGLPLPIAVPFGYFPFTKKYSSGIIFPTVGDDYRRGFYLSNGGYYFAINDNVDLALTGQLYTKGTWGIHARSAYVK